MKSHVIKCVSCVNVWTHVEVKVCIMQFAISPGMLLILHLPLFLNVRTETNLDLTARRNALHYFRDGKMNILKNIYQTKARLHHFIPQYYSDLGTLCVSRGKLQRHSPAPVILKEISVFHSDKSHKSWNTNLLLQSFLSIYSEDKHHFESWASGSYSLQVVVPVNRLLKITLLQLLLMSGLMLICSWKLPSPFPLSTLSPASLSFCLSSWDKEDLSCCCCRIRSENENNVSLVIRNKYATYILLKSLTVIYPTV